MEDYGSNTSNHNMIKADKRFYRIQWLRYPPSNTVIKSEIRTRANWLTQTELTFLSMKQIGVLLLPLSGILVHHSLTPPHPLQHSGFPNNLPFVSARSRTQTSSPAGHRVLHMVTEDKRNVTKVVVALPIKINYSKRP